MELKDRSTISKVEPSGSNSTAAHKADRLYDFTRKLPVIPVILILVAIKTPQFQYFSFNHYK